MKAWTPEELKSHLENGDRVFLKLWKKGCGICKMSIPATERMEENNVHQLQFGMISTDEYPEMLEIAGAETLPVFFVFADKEMKGQFLGFKGLKQLEDFVNDALSK